MKSLMLLNARRRKKKARRSTRRATARRTTRRRTTRRTTARRTTRRRSARRTTRRSSRAIRLKRGKSVTIMANPRRRSRRSGGMRFGGNILSQVKGVFSKENLTVAGGGVAAAMLTNKLLSLEKADKTPVLPLPTDPNTLKLARIGYAVGIPVLGAILTRKFNASLAKGMVYGGLINGIIEATKSYAPDFAKQVGFSEYLEYTPMSALNGTPGYSAINQFSNVRPMNGAFSNSSAFPADAWGR